jgi:FtsP/CotA-like multicopper oxidase with cupredoxin domain
MIAPGDSLVVRFAPPRAGTFMYHSHSNEMQQIASGLYGTIVVREPGAPRDTTADRVLVFADGGPTINFFVPPPPVLVNGHADPAPMTVPAGRTVRLRMVNIRSELLTRVALLADSVPVRWRVVAKDGMPVAASRQRDVPASLVFSPGEIYDVEVQVPADRPLTLRWLSDNLPPPLQAPHTMVLRGG